MTAWERFTAFLLVVLTVSWMGFLFFLAFANFHP